MGIYVNKHRIVLLKCYDESQRYPALSQVFKPRVEETSFNYGMSNEDSPYDMQLDNVTAEKAGLWVFSFQNLSSSFFYHRALSFSDIIY